MFILQRKPAQEQGRIFFVFFCFNVFSDHHMQLHVKILVESPRREETLVEIFPALPCTARARYFHVFNWKLVIVRQFFSSLDSALRSNILRHVSLYVNQRCDCCKKLFYLPSQREDDDVLLVVNSDYLRVAVRLEKERKTFVSIFFKKRRSGLFHFPVSMSETEPLSRG